MMSRWTVGNSGSSQGIHCCLYPTLGSCGFFFGGKGELQSFEPSGDERQLLNYD